MKISGFFRRVNTNLCRKYARAIVFTVIFLNFYGFF